MTEKYTIKDLENLSGIKAHTLRIWEQRYSIIKPSRTDTNIRYYSGQQLKKILNVSLLNKYGFKISHIDKMSEDEIGKKILALNSPEAQQEKIINSLIQNMVDLNMQSFEATISQYIAAKGVEKAVLHIIYPYLEKVGMLWLTNHINPAQEHLVSNIIRQKLILGIENTSPVLESGKSVMLFLPEGEYHEITLLFIHYMMKRRGIQVIYLGNSLPVTDAAYVANYLKPAYIYTHLTTNSSKLNIYKLSESLIKMVPDCKLVFSGRITTSYSGPVSPGVLLIRSLEDLLHFINKL